LWVRSVLLIDILGIISAFCPKQSVILRFALSGCAPGEKGSGLGSGESIWLSP
jgi:hypothetical protein